MSCFQKKCVRRLGVYGLLLIAAGGYLLLTRNGGGIPCFFYERFHVLCPACGATRALSSLVRLDLPAAAAFHPVFALGLYPIAGLIALEDIAACVYRLCTGRERLSLLQFFCGGYRAKGGRP